MRATKWSIGSGVVALRPGFTLIELLVCVLILALITAMTLPALQGGRESARRTACASNLRSVGMALSVYHDAYGSYPPGRMLAYDRRFAGGRSPCTSLNIEKSLFLFAMPFLEQASAFNSINHDLAIVAAENATVQSTVVSVFVCPSDPSAHRPRRLPPGSLADYGELVGSGDREMALTSYAGMAGSSLAAGFPRPVNRCRPSAAALARNDGVFNDVSPIGRPQITDGLSHSLIVAEKSIATIEAALRDDPRELALHGWLVTGNWGDTIVTSFYPVNPTHTISASVRDAHLFAASSRHPGGGEALMADGSVRFVKDTIASWPRHPLTGAPAGAVRLSAGYWARLPPPEVWQAITTRSGGELIGTADLD